jgi:hypothetical protein
MQCNESPPQINVLFQSVEGTWYMALTKNMRKVQHCDSHEVQADPSTIEWNSAPWVMRKQEVHVLCLQRRNHGQLPVTTSKKPGLGLSPHPWGNNFCQNLNEPGSSAPWLISRLNAAQLTPWLHTSEICSKRPAQVICRLLTHRHRQ